MKVFLILAVLLLGYVNKASAEPSVVVMGSRASGSDMIYSVTINNWLVTDKQ